MKLTDFIRSITLHDFDQAFNNGALPGVPKNEIEAHKQITSDMKEFPLMWDLAQQSSIARYTGDAHYILMMSLAMRVMYMLYRKAKDVDFNESAKLINEGR